MADRWRSVSLIALRPKSHGGCKLGGQNSAAVGLACETCRRGEVDVRGASPSDDSGLARGCSAAASGDGGGGAEQEVPYEVSLAAERLPGK